MKYYIYRGNILEILDFHLFAADLKQVGLHLLLERGSSVINGGRVAVYEESNLGRAQPGTGGLQIQKVSPTNPKNHKNKLAKLGDGIAISKSVTIYHSPTALTDRNM